jgi:hypothetical protein
MLLRGFPIILGVTIVSLLAAACAPNLESEESAPAQAPAGETASNQAQDSGEGEAVDVTPMSETELAAQPTGQSQPGAGATNEGSQGEPEEEDEQPQPGELVVYADSTFKFSVSYPADFVFRAQPMEKLANLKPKPEAAFIIMNPVTASSDIVDLEPADLEIRVYGVGQITSLESWLTSDGLLPVDGSVPLRPFHTAHISGVEVCASTLIAPGCSYFVLGKGWVYQLTPATLEGEAMIDTFMLIP